MPELCFWILGTNPVEQVVFGRVALSWSPQVSHRALPSAESVVLATGRGGRRRATGASAAWTSSTSSASSEKGPTGRSTKPRTRTQVSMAPGRSTLGVCSAPCQCCSTVTDSCRVRSGSSTSKGAGEQQLWNLEFSAQVPALLVRCCALGCDLMPGQKVEVATGASCTPAF